MWHPTASKIINTSEKPAASIFWVLLTQGRQSAFPLYCSPPLTHYYGHWILNYSLSYSLILQKKNYITEWLIYGVSQEWQFLIRREWIPPLLCSSANRSHWRFKRTNTDETAVCWHGKNKTIATSNLVSALPGKELNGTTLKRWNFGTHWNKLLP
jgi:hypothetical protein